MINCIIVGLGGAIGAMGRYLIGLLPLKPESGFPLATFLINISGAFCIGLIAAYTARHVHADPRMILFLKTGICGGFTTFSTFSLESCTLLRDGRTALGIIYIMASVILGIAAVFAADFFVRG